jgi:hypothetical protein
MPDGPTIGAADGGRHGLPGGTARAHEQPVASARPTDGVPGSPVRQSPRLCANSAQTASAGLRHADPVPAALYSCVKANGAGFMAAPLARRGPGGPSPDSIGNIAGADNADVGGAHLGSSRIRGRSVRPSRAPSFCLEVLARLTAMNVRHALSLLDNPNGPRVVAVISSRGPARCHAPAFRVPAPSQPRACRRRRRCGRACSRSPRRSAFRPGQTPRLSRRP